MKKKATMTLRVVVVAILIVTSVIFASAIFFSQFSTLSSQFLILIGFEDTCEDSGKTVSGYKVDIEKRLKSTPPLLNDASDLYFEFQSCFNEEAADESYRKRIVGLASNLLDSKDQKVRKEALVFLVRLDALGMLSLEELIKAEKSTSDYLDDASLFYEIGNKGNIDYLKNLLDDPKYASERSVIVIAIAKSGKQAAFNFLVPLVKDPNHELRSVSVVGLRHFRTAALQKNSATLLLQLLQGLDERFVGDELIFQSNVIESLRCSALVANTENKQLIVQGFTDNKKRFDAIEEKVQETSVKLKFRGLILRIDSALEDINEGRRDELC